MRKTLPILAAVLTIPFLTGATCGGLLVITLGAGELPEFVIDRDYDIGGQNLTGCPEGDTDITDTETGTVLTLRTVKTASGCAISFREAEMLLFDEAQARQASDQLEGRQIDGLQEASLIINDFQMDDTLGNDIDIETALTDLTFTIDGQVLFNRAHILALDNGPVRTTLDGALLDKLTTGINNGTAVTVDVWVRIEVTDAGLAALPATLHIKALLQPELKLDVVKAAKSVSQ